MSTSTTFTTAPVTFEGARLVRYTEHPRMSQETTAFDAEVHIHAKRVGTLTNAGHGGESIFQPDSASGAAAFHTASENFPGIVNDEYGFTNDLIDTLAETAHTAKVLSHRGIAFVPDKGPEDLVRDTGNVAAYKVPAKDAQDLDRLLPSLMADTGATTFLFPVKEKKGVWLHTTD